MRFCLRDIARHAPQKIKSQQSLTRERFQRDARMQLQLAEVTYTLRLRAGVYLGGGHWAMAPVWVARIAKFHRKVSKIEACPPPPFASWASGFGLEITCFGRKMGRNMSVTISNSDLCSS